MITPCTRVAMSNEYSELWIYRKVWYPSEAATLRRIFPGFPEHFCKLASVIEGYVGSIQCHVSAGSTGVRPSRLLLLEQFRLGAERGHQVQRERNRKPRVPRSRAPFAARVCDRRRAQGRLQCFPQTRVSSRGDDRFQDMFPLDFPVTSASGYFLRKRSNGLPNAAFDVILRHRKFAFNNVSRARSGKIAGRFLPRFVAF